MAFAADDVVFATAAPAMSGQVPGRFGALGLALAQPFQIDVNVGLGQLALYFHWYHLSTMGHRQVDLDTSAAAVGLDIGVNFAKYN